MTLPIELETKETDELNKAVAIELEAADNLEHFKRTIDEHTTGNNGSDTKDNEQAST
jgi:hypothetical protein